jgi:NAD+ diphosphatase
MSFRLFDAPLREPSQFVGFAGNTIDRQSENRADDSVEKALADPTTRLLLMNGGRLHLKLGGGGLDPWFSAAECEPFKPSFWRCQSESRPNSCPRPSRRSTIGRSICKG